MAFGRLKVDQIETSTQIVNVDDLTAANGISDGDKGDITVASGGTVWTVNNGAVDYSELANPPSFTGPIVAGRESGTGALQGLSLGSGLSIAGGTLSATVSGGGTGTVTSVGLSVPSGFSVTGSPVTSSGSIALSFAAGYSLPTTASQANWDTAYSERLYWDGGATGLNATTGRASLGLGNSATLNVGTTAGTVAAGDALGVHEAAADPHPNYALESSLATVATTGSYADLSNVPSFTGPIVAGRASGTGALESLTLGAGLSIVGSQLTVSSSGAGTVTSVGLVAPSGFVVSGSPVTGAGDLSLSFAAGYSLPTTASQVNWDTAYSERLYWDGGSTGLNAASGRTSLGLAAVASTGAYSDLTGTPVIPSGADATPQSLGVAAVGVSADYAREDHVHAMPSAGDVGADPAGTSASGITAHEAAADPHPNYALESSLATVATTGSYTDLTNKPVIPSGADALPQNLGVATIGVSADYAREDHAHAMPSAGDVGADPAGTSASGITAHEAAADPHPGYALESSLGGAALLNVGTTSGTVAAGDDQRFVPSGGTAGQVFTKSSGTDYDAAWNDLPATDLSYDPATRQLASSTGADATLPLFSSTEAGLTPQSGGGTTNFLRADGTWAAPSGGGGGLTHFVESEDTASPNATVPVDALTATDAGYTNIDVALVAKGTGATLAQVPDGTATGGNKRGQYATDLQKTRSANTQVATGDYSVLVGGRNGVASGAYSVVTGGSNNSSTGIYSFIGGGASNTASSTYSFIGGGGSNTSSSTYSVVCGGQSNVASAVNSVVVGGINCTADSSYSFATGFRATTRGILGYHALAPIGSDAIQNKQGVQQMAFLLLARQTADATPTVLTSNTSAASTTNQVILPNNAAYYFKGSVIAGVTGAGDTAAWSIEGAIKRGANAASTTMVGSPTVTMTHNDAGAASWIVTVTADTTNGGIKVEVTGAAATTIRWVCKLETTEMTY